MFVLLLIFSLGAYNKIVNREFEAKLYIVNKVYALIINNKIYCICLLYNLLTKQVLYIRKSKYFFKRKLVNPFLALLTTGITPRKLALTVALGFVIGIFPFFGIASLFCTLVGLRFKLNIPALLLICYVAGPFHFLLYLPFIKMGIWMFDADAFRFSLDEVLNMLREDWIKALKKLWLANLLGIVAWILVSAPVTGFIYLLMLPIFRKLVRVPATKDEEESNVNPEA